jgi:hypothetical protein
MSKPKRFISLDLDSTLIFSSMEMKSYYDLFRPNNTKDSDKKCTTNCDIMNKTYQLLLRDVGVVPGSGEITPMWGVFRPHLLDKFIPFMEKYFDGVFIWSAGQTTYVDAIIDKSFNGSLQPDIVYSYPNCVFVGNYIYKDLSKLLAESVSQKLGANLTNTFALDDRLDTFSHNPNNGIQIPEFIPSLTSNSIKQDDISLLQLIEWLTLSEVENAPDIRNIKNLRVPKEKIFTTSLEEYKLIKNGIPSIIKTGFSKILEKRSSSVNELSSMISIE